MSIENLKNKKIAIVGLGTNNRGLAKYLSTNGIAFETIEEWNNPADLIGKLDGFEIIFRTPGLPYLSEPIQTARKKGALITSQTKLFFELCPAPIIGVTGTKGKGTTSSLITKIFEAAGNKVWLGGNIGRDPFEFLDQIRPTDIVILELSSFQLQDLDKSPHVAIVLSITPDHLNHHESMDEYIKAKSNILAFQNPGDFAILHSSLPDWLKNLGKGKKVFIQPEEVKDFPRKLLGGHNLDNIAAASCAAKIYKIDTQIIKKAVAEFQPLPHRLNVLGKHNGITFIDDAFSTNVEPTMAAIDAIEGNTVLIIGGSDKGVDFTQLGEKISKSEKIKGLVIIGDVTDKIMAATKNFKYKALTGAKTMDEILSQAKSLASPGDIVLFSPGTASFGLFKNEFDRAEQFVNAVNKL